MDNNIQTDAILNAIKEREREHFRLLSVSSSLASVGELSEFSTVVQQHLKSPLGFDGFVVCTADPEEKQYRVFFHSGQNSNEITDETFEVRDGIFNTTLQSADPILFHSGILSKNKIKVPTFIASAFQSGIFEIAALPLAYQKNNPSIVLLFYKKPANLDRSTFRFLKSLCFPMALAVSNVIVMQKIALHQNANTPFVTPNSTKTKSGNPSEIVSEIIGSGPEIRKVIDLIKQVANSESGILILGESGTGKEIVAKSIHNLSARKAKDMVKINCAAIPANLIESELFGHEKGSFTGATATRIGKFELADNSTLFLDEISELPLDLQTKLLRVLQEREIERIGGRNTIKVNVRIIAATNCDLQAEVDAGRFRSDLFYRLNIVPIALPPLRKRPEDIEALSHHFIEIFARKSGRNITGLSAKALESMKLYPWPGNVRELEHLIERSVLLNKGSIIKDIGLPEIGNANAISNTDFRIKTLHEIEKEHILKVIKLCNGRISGPNGAAIKLQIPSTTLISKMEKLGIRKAHFIGKHI